MDTRKSLLAWALLGLAWIAVSRPAYCSSVSFAPAQNYSVGTNPRAVAAADFNGDGKMDLAVANYRGPTASDNGGISILLGNGDGTFQPANNIAAGKNPFTIKAADFNGDGRADLVLIDSNGVGVLLGHGDGTFGSVTYFPAANFPYALAVADLDGDNVPDLVVAANSLSVLLGNGDGTFQAHVDYSTSHGLIGANVVAGDVNGDGKMDLIESLFSGVQVLLGNGDGSFQSPIFSHGASFSGFLVMADFNLDGKPDIAQEFANGLANQHGVVVMLGNGDGTFQFPPSTDLSFAGAMSTGDVNGDSKADLVIVSGAAANLFLGNGDSTFQSALSVAVGAGPYSVVAADFNQDKAPDLAVTNSADNSISVLLNTTGADFSITASTPNPATVGRGQSSTSTVTLNLLNTFDNPVALSCSVQPAQSAPACSLNPNSVAFDASGNATATLTMNTGAANASLVPSSLPHDSRPLQFLWLPVAGFALMGTGLGSSRPVKRKLGLLLLGTVLFGGLVFLAACGGSGGGPKSTNYTVTITGASGITQHSTTVVLTVQ